MSQPEDPAAGERAAGFNDPNGPSDIPDPMPDDLKQDVDLDDEDIAGMEGEAPSS